MGKSKANISLGFMVSSQQAAVGNYWHGHDTGPVDRLPYSKEELSVIREYFLPRGVQYCHEQLPHRSIHSIRHKARDMGLKTRERKLWTRDELHIVSMGIVKGLRLADITGSLAEAGFTRTFFAVRDCASVLRIEIGSAASM